MYQPAAEPGFHLYNGPSIHARSVFFILISVALMIVDSHFSALKTVRSYIELGLAPIKKVVAIPAFGFSSVGFYFRDRSEIIRENEDLLQKILITGYAEQRLLSLQEENDQLKELLNVRKMPSQSLLTVEVLESGTDPFLQRVTIDKGSMAGVTEGAAVLDPYGVVGQVTRVMPTRAEVTLIVERNFMIPIRNERNGKRGILYGAGAGKPLELRFVTLDADPRVGDRLVTSGLDNIYPLGLSVATISSVQPNAEALFMNVAATPTARISDERYLLVVRSDAKDSQVNAVVLPISAEREAFVDHEKPIATEKPASAKPIANTKPASNEKSMVTEKPADTKKVSPTAASPKTPAPVPVAAPRPAVKEATPQPIAAPKTASPPAPRFASEEKAPKPAINPAPEEAPAATPRATIEDAPKPQPSSEETPPSNTRPTLEETP